MDLNKDTAVWRLYSHLVKRVFDEYGVEITSEWEKRVLAGEQDVPLPKVPDPPPPFAASVS